MKQPETKVKERFFSELRKLVDVWFEKIQQVGKRGTPDVVGCVRCEQCGFGRFFGGEVKATASDRPDSLQRHKMSKILEAGGLTFTVHRENVGEVVGQISSLKERKTAKKSLKGQKPSERRTKV